jgi:hypothetical protein
MNKLLNNNKYIIVASTYGFTRKYFQMRNTTQLDHKYEHKIPILFTQKILISTVCGMASMYLWPYYLYNDLNKIEISLSNKKPEEYGYIEKKHLFEHFYD